MNIRILDPASKDLINGFHFYEKQEAGIGNYFLDCLYADIDSLKLYAGIHRMKFGFRYLLSKRFPYAIYYKFNAHDKTVFIHAVLDCRQATRKTAKRLR